MSSDVMVLLKADHKEMRRLFREFTGAGYRGRRDRFANVLTRREVCRGLLVALPDVADAQGRHSEITDCLGRRPAPAERLPAGRCG
jgi:hypothetical protein